MRERRTGNEADRRVEALDLEAVLDRDGQAVERADRLTLLGEVGVELGGVGEGVVVADLSQAVGLEEEQEQEQEQKAS